MEVAIIGGGIAGLSLAINLHQRGIPCHVYESIPDPKELGVGLTLLPHGMRELTRLGVAGALQAVGGEIRESLFFNRFGQLAYKEPRGRQAGYEYPEVSISRGVLHMALYQAARMQLGAGRITTDCHCVAVEQEDGGVTLRMRTSSGAMREPARADVAIACDGIHSAVRKQFYPDDRVVYAGINSWRGVTRQKPVLDGKSWIRIGSMRRGAMVIYPIEGKLDAQGNQLVNWIAWLQSDSMQRNDWNKQGRLEDFLPYYADWKFDWADVPEMLRRADVILELPLVDKDPLDRWTFGRVTLAGDAAHPMYPRGSNGAAQALIDVRTLAELLANGGDPAAALKAYEEARLGPTSAVVRTNRNSPPDFINMKVEELTGDRPFQNLDDYITQDELRALSERYKRIAGFGLKDLR